MPRNCEHDTDGKADNWSVWGSQEEYDRYEGEQAHQMWKRENIFRDLLYEGARGTWILVVEVYTNVAS